MIGNIGVNKETVNDKKHSKETKNSQDPQLNLKIQKAVKISFRGEYILHFKSNISMSL